MAFDSSNAFGIGRYVQRELDSNGRFVYENSALNEYGLGDLILYFNQTNQTWMVYLKIELLSKFYVVAQKLTHNFFIGLS